MTDSAWLAQVEAGHPPRFGHREHLKLAWLLLEVEPDLDAAMRRVSTVVHRLAVAHGKPQKYHRTVTDAWVRVVAHCRERHSARGFDEFLSAYPWLLDKRLLTRHYRTGTLASRSARTSWVPPDLSPIPV